jgi:hypothetical protein
MTTEAAPGVLPFTNADYLAIDAYRPQLALLGGAVWIEVIDPVEGSEGGFISEPGSRQADWAFWRWADGTIHFEPLPDGWRPEDGAGGAANDLASLLQAIRACWRNDAKRRADMARRSGLGSLPAWLRSDGEAR